MTTQLLYLDIHECENVSEEGNSIVKKMKRATLVLEPYSLQKQKIIENPLRQVGFPSRGRCRPTERSYMSFEDDIDRFPERERIMMAMDRRRRYFGLLGARINRDVAAVVANAVEGGNQAAQAPVNEEELAMMMELNNHPMFNDDEGAGNFYEFLKNRIPIQKRKKKFQ